MSITDQGDQPHTCPRGCFSNITPIEYDSETSDVTITMQCLDCKFTWLEHYAFRYWRKLEIDDE